MALKGATSSLSSGRSKCCGCPNMRLQQQQQQQQQQQHKKPCACFGHVAAWLTLKRYSKMHNVNHQCCSASAGSQPVRSSVPEYYLTKLSGASKPEREPETLMRECAFNLKVLECLSYGHHRRRFTGSAHDQSGPLITAAPVAYLYCPWCCCTYRDSLFCVYVVAS
jgi:hypothetical protein